MMMELVISHSIPKDENRYLFNRFNNNDIILWSDNHLCFFGRKKVITFYYGDSGATYQECFVRYIGDYNDFL
jgi:hypothetical protein